MHWLTPAGDVAYATSRRPDSPIPNAKPGVDSCAIVTGVGSRAAWRGAIGVIARHRPDGRGELATLKDVPGYAMAIWIAERGVQ